MARLKSIVVAVVAGLSGAATAQSTDKLPAPCDDFYGHVNSAWIAATALPPDRVRIGSFDELQLRNKRIVERALDEALRNPALLDTPGKHKAATFYASGMNTAAIEQQGLTALQPLLTAIDQIEERGQLVPVLARLNRVGISAPVSIWVGADARDKRRHRVSINASGLGLPDRDDYVRTDERAVAVRSAYQSYVQKLLELGGTPAAEAAEAAAQVLQLEARFAESMLKRTEMRDPNRLYHLMTVDELARQAPGVAWHRWLDALGLGGADGVVVTQPAFALAAARALRDVPLPVWRAYLRLRLLNAAAPFLPAGFERAHFAFHRGVLRGQQQDVTRAEKVIDLINGPRGTEPLAEGLGQLYVAKAFSPAAKERATAMVEDIRTAMATRIERLEWMGPATKARALAKLKAMTLQIGYPDKWRSYEGLLIVPDDFAGNWLRAEQWATARAYARLNQPVDRSEWFTTPYLVNAFAASFNNIVFPAGILQPPYFDPSADDATNFGGIGAVIGHEITHHFDDRGRQFDEFGNLANWWTDEDAKAYQARADRLAAQYSGYSPLPGHHINGVQTLGENISDLGGVKIAYDGLQLALARNKSGTDARALSQRFFINYATIWRDKARAEFIITQLRSGQHSPARYRVLGSLANVPAFAEAFSCPPGSPMVRPETERISIW